MYHAFSNPDSPREEGQNRSMMKKSTPPQDNGVRILKWTPYLVHWRIYVLIVRLAQVGSMSIRIAPSINKDYEHNEY